MIYFAEQDTRSADGVGIRKGQCVWFKETPSGNTAEARMEDGSLRTVTVADFKRLAVAGAPK